MLIVNNKVFKHKFNEGATDAKQRAELIAIFDANKGNKQFKDAIVNYTNELISSNNRYSKDTSFSTFESLYDAVESGIEASGWASEALYATTIKNLLQYAKKFLDINKTSTSTATKTNNKSASDVSTKKNTTKADKDVIIDAIISPETDTTSMSDELISKVNSIPGNAQSKILDPLKVSGETECDFVGNTHLSDSDKDNTFYHDGKLDYAINVLTILLRGGKIRLKLKTEIDPEDESQTILFGASSSMKPDLASLLNAILDFRLDTIDYNNNNEYYNALINNPKDAGKLFTQITGVKITKISKSSQVKGDLNGIVADKVLGPQKLNLTLKGGYTLETFRDAIIDGINEHTGEGSSRKIAPELAKSLIALVNKVVDDEKAEGPSIEELLFEKKISHKKVVLNYKFNDGDINKEEINKARNRIMNDFGEVIGPLALLRYLKGAEKVEFGTDLSEAMKDYTITHNGIAMGVSAKSEKGGNAPDIKPALSVLKSFIVDGQPMDAIVDGAKSQITFDNLLQKNYVDNVDQIKKAREFFSMLINATTTEGDATLTQKQLLILVDHMYGQEDCVKNYLCPAMEIDSLMDFVISGFNIEGNKCDKFFEKPYSELKNVFDRISSATGKADQKGFPSERDFAKLSNKLKLGYFITPLIQASVDKANKMFGLDKKSGNKVDIISAVLRLAFDYKQIYLGVSCDNNSITVTLKFNQMNVGDWKFTSKAMITNPWKQGILMTMVN